MKGIILAGGKGTRLYPLTVSMPKALLPLYDKPMIYYPLTTLLNSGIKDILIITNLEQIADFHKILGNGSRFGAKIKYKHQPEPKGIADAFIIGKKFIGKDDVTLILGDNVLHGDTIFKRAVKHFDSGAIIFGYEVKDPERYGVVEFNSHNKAISIEEKPENAKSNYAIPGLYIYDNSVVDVAANLKPSKRGELEISDVNSHFLQKGTLFVHKLSRGCAWLDAGTPDSFIEASNYICAIEKRQGVKVGCPEEAALRAKLIKKDLLKKKVDKMPKSEYKDYLSSL